MFLFGTTVLCTLGWYKGNKTKSTTSTSLRSHFLCFVPGRPVVQKRGKRGAKKKCHLGGNCGRVTLFCFCNFVKTAFVKKMQISWWFSVTNEVFHFSEMRVLMRIFLLNKLSECILWALQFEHHWIESLASYWCQAGSRIGLLGLFHSL